VLAVGQRVSMEQKAPVNANNGQPEPFRNVTLLVKPEQAEALQLASQTGRLWLLLRNGTDNNMEKSIGVTVADLRGKSSRVLRDTDPFAMPISNLMPTAHSSSTTQPSANPYRVKIIRGGQESEVVFPEPSKLTTDPGVVTTTSERNQ